MLANILTNYDKDLWIVMWFLFHFNSQYYNYNTVRIWNTTYYHLQLIYKNNKTVLSKRSFVNFIFWFCCTNSDDFTSFVIGFYTLVDCSIYANGVGLIYAILMTICCFKLG